jgi:hypothetical protein
MASYIYAINNTTDITYSNKRQSVKLVNINDEATAMVLGFQVRRNRCNVLLAVGVTEELKGVVEATVLNIALVVRALYF